MMAKCTDLRASASLGSTRTRMTRERARKIPTVTQRQKKIDAADVPQCFSHFTHSVTDGKHLVCDLQGVWNRFDGYVLTDPVVQTKARQFRKFF
eukprot:2148946-Rhodomonas_salina.1